MRIELIDKTGGGDHPLRAFVGRHGLVFHSEAWLRNFDRQKLNQCVILNKNNEVIGCFLYYRFKKLAFEFIITPPYTQSIELFYVNPSESVVGKASFDKEIIGLLADYFCSLKVSYTGVYLPSHVVDTQPMIWAGFSASVRYTYQLSLHLTEEQLLANLSPEKRKSINKAQKDDLEIKETSDYDEVEKLVLKSLSRSEVASNLSIIHDILHEFSRTGAVKAFIAYRQGKPAGTSVFVADKKKALYLFGGFDEDNKHHGAGVSCMWQAILKARQMGLTIFDFEGSMSAGIERYYREFGGRITPYYKVEKAGFLVRTLMKLKGVN